MPATSDVPSQIDALIQAAFQPHEPGAAVIAVKFVSEALLPYSRSHLC